MEGLHMRTFRVASILEPETETVRADSFSVIETVNESGIVHSALFYQHVLGEAGGVEKVQIHYVRNPTSIIEVEDEHADLERQIAAGLDHIRANYGTYFEAKDLPQGFWDYIDAGKRVQAVKALRQATGLSLKSAKNIVDRLSRNAPGTPRVAEVWRVSSLESLPVGTVIRIEGVISDRTRFGGYVFEKMGTDDWETPGVETRYASDGILEKLSDAQTWTVLFVPGSSS